MLNVPEGISLTIEPGTIVQFDSGSGIMAYGSLCAVGSEQNEILFEKAPHGREGKWHGIILRNSSIGTISHAAISGAQYGVGIAVTGDHVQYPNITSSTIRGCDVGIYAWGVVQADQNRIIVNNHIEDCTFGIVTNQGDTKCEPVFEDNTVYRSGNKGLWIERSKPVFLRNTVEESAKEGVLCRFAGNAEFGRNMREAPPGLNIIRNNETIQLSSMYASPFLGIVVDESSCELTAGGLNRVYHESDRVLRVRVQGPGSIVQADKTFWGYPVQEDWFEEEEKGIVIRRCPLKPEMSVEEELLVEAGELRATGEYEGAISVYEPSWRITVNHRMQRRHSPDCRRRMMFSLQRPAIPHFRT